MNNLSTLTALFIFLGFTLSNVLGAPPAPYEIDGVAAVVDGDIITFSDVRQLCDSSETDLRQKLTGPELVQALKKIRLNALDDLINRKLIIHDFKNRKFALPDEIVEERINTVIEAQYKGDQVAFARALQANDVKLEEFRRQSMEAVIVAAMRSSFVTKPATGQTPEERQKIEQNWLAGLRAQAFVKKF